MPAHELPQPQREVPQRTVEAVYPILNPANGEPAHDPAQLDIASRDRMEAHLVDRMNHRPSRAQPGGIIEIPRTPSRRPNISAGDRWYPGYHSRKVVAGVGLAIAALNVSHNFDNIGHAIQDMGMGIDHGVSEAYNGVTGWFDSDDGPNKNSCTPSSVTAVTVLGEFHHQTIHIGTEQINGDTPAAANIAAARQKIAELNAGGTEVISVVAQGDTSDDARMAPNLGEGKADAINTTIGTKMERETSADLRQALPTRDFEIIDNPIKQVEHVLSKRQWSTIDKASSKYGFASTREALNVYDANPNDMPAKLRKVFDKYIGSNRGATVDVLYKDADSAKVTNHPGNCPPEQPTSSHSDPGPDYKKVGWRGKWWDLIPLAGLIPIVRPKFGWVDHPRTRKVTVPPQMKNPEYLMLYPNALRPVGGVSRENEPVQNRELVHEAWAYDRKNQDLLREPNRIQGVLGHTYRDANGEEHTLRSMFIDHQPSQAVLAIFSQAFGRASQMRDGRIGHDLSMISVYPEANVGRHGDAKRVGLGQEVQYDANVLGVAIPSIGLIEMYVPAVQTEKQLKALKQTLDEAMAHILEETEHTLSHEALGHFTDLNQKRNILRVLDKGDQHRVPIYQLPNRFEDSAEAIYDDFEQQAANEEPVRYTITRTRRNLRGELVTVTETVEGDDPRLTEAEYIRREHSTTPYGGSSAAEEYAEAAWDYATGAGVPTINDTEFGVTPKDGFADRYHTSTAMHQLLANRWGADPSQNELVFNAPHRIGTTTYGPLEDDEHMVRLATEARQTPVPDRRDLIHVLTGTRLDNHSQPKPSAPRSRFAELKEFVGRRRANQPAYAGRHRRSN